MRISPIPSLRLLILGLLLVGCACAGKALDPALADLPVDERIRVQVLRALRADAEVDHEAIRVEVRDREVILSGVVSSYEESRRALRIAGAVDDVAQVTNRLRVLPRRATGA